MIPRSQDILVPTGTLSPARRAFKTLKREVNMDLERLKKTLAKLGVASLIAGSALALTGCPKSTGTSS